MRGLTPAQVERVFEEIATCAGTLADLLSYELVNAHPEKCAQAHGMLVMAQRIGALADHVIDDECRGGMLDWFVGGNFDALAVPQQAEATA